MRSMDRIGAVALTLTVLATSAPAQEVRLLERKPEAVVGDNGFCQATGVVNFAAE